MDALAEKEDEEEIANNESQEPAHANSKNLPQTYSTTSDQKWAKESDEPNKDQAQNQASWITHLEEEMRRLRQKQSIIKDEFKLANMKQDLLLKEISCCKKIDDPINLKKKFNMNCLK